MKIIVDELPSYCGDCLFCSDIFYDVCDISKSRCALSKLEDCPYLITLGGYLASIKEKENEDY